MLLLAEAAWDGVGSSIVGSVIGGATVAVSLWVTIRHEGHVRRAETERRAQADERQAANQLLIAVHDLRDAAARSKAGTTGDFQMWPLRKQILLSESMLVDFDVYTATQAFYDRAIIYRDWARKNRAAPDETSATMQRRDLDEFGSKVIWLLQHIHDRPIATLADVPVGVWSRPPEDEDRRGASC